MKLKKKIVAMVASVTILINVLGAYANVPSIDEAWNQLTRDQQAKLEQVGIDPSTLDLMDSKLDGIDIGLVLSPPLKYENDQFTVSKNDAEQALYFLSLVVETELDEESMLKTFYDVIADINSNSSQKTKQDFANILKGYGLATIGKPGALEVPGGLVIPGGGSVAPGQIKGKLEGILDNLNTVSKPNKAQVADFQKTLEVLSSYMIDPLTSLTTESVQKSWEQSIQWQEQKAKGMVFAKANAPVARWDMTSTTDVTIPKGLWDQASPYGRLELEQGGVVLIIEKDTYTNGGSKVSVKPVYGEGYRQGVTISSTSKIHSPAKIGFFIEDENPQDYGVYKLEDKKETLIGGIYNEARGTVEALVKSSGTYIIKKAPAKSYADLTNVDWAKKEIEHLAQKGYIKGKEERIYAPKDQITRAEFAVLLTRVLQLPGASTPNKFVDMKSDAWYYNDVMATVEAGLFNGKSANNFDPRGEITRQEITAIISRILMQRGYSEPKVEVAEKGLWAPGAIALMRDQDLTIKIPDFNDNIRENANRAEVAYILYNLLKR